MNIRFFILVILLIGVAFTIIPDAGPDDPKYDFFLLTQKKVSVIVFAYHLLEHAAWIMIAYTMAVEIPKHRPFLICFMWVKVGDMIDYILVYNRDWGYEWLSFNTVSFLFMVIVYLNESGWINKSR